MKEDASDDMTHTDHNNEADLSIADRLATYERVFNEMYKSQTGHDNPVIADSNFAKLSPKKKIKQLHAELIKFAEQEGIALPR